MSQELSLRQKAICWKQAGRAVSWICQRLERSREWFYKWWNRYQLDGVSGLRGSLACAANQSASLVRRNASSDPRPARPLDAASSTLCE